MTLGCTIRRDEMTIIIAFVLGLLAGVIPKGIHIHVYKSAQQTKKKENEAYNESLAGYLQPEVQNYYQETQGFNRF